MFADQEPKDQQYIRRFPDGGVAFDLLHVCLVVDRVFLQTQVLGCLPHDVEHS